MMTTRLMDSLLSLGGWKHDFGKVFKVNNMYRKIFLNLTICMTALAFLTMSPRLSLSADGIISYNDGLYVLNPEKMNENSWKILRQNEDLQGISLTNRQGGVLDESNPFYSSNPFYTISESQIRALKQLTCVRSISIYGCQNIDELLQALKTLPKLRKLNLTLDQDCPIEIYRELASLTQLEELYLYGDFITEEGMACVCRLGNLKKLRISTRQELPPRQIEMLKNLENLRFLEIPNALISDRTLQAYGKILSLEELHLSLMGEFATTITSLRPVPFSQEELAAMRAETPASDSKPITKEGIQGLASLRNLRILTLSLPSRTVNGELAPLFTMTSLESLALEGGYRDQDICDIDKLTNLRELYLSSFLMTGKAIKPLAKLNQLQELKLDFAPDAPDASEDLAVLSHLNLRFINLSGNACITDRVIPVLAKFPNLDHIDLKYANVSECYQTEFGDDDFFEPIENLFKKKTRRKR